MDWQGTPFVCTVHCTGFFENKEADAKARGEAPPKKQTAAEAFSDFMASVSSDVRQVSVGVPNARMCKPHRCCKWPRQHPSSGLGPCIMPGQLSF